VTANSHGECKIIMNYPANGPLSCDWSVMANDGQPFELRLIETEIIDEGNDTRSRLRAADLQTSPALPMEVFDALKATRGAPALIEGIPALDKPFLWSRVAYFSISKMTGSALFIRLAGEAEITPQLEIGIGGGGLPQPSRIDCVVSLSSGDYIFSARLARWAAQLTPIVKCSIDGVSLGELVVSETMLRPYVARLRSGAHIFRIEEFRNPFMFLSLTVSYIPVYALV
jgi:hypothetical protein